MSARFDVPAETRARQERVSDPAVSAWVSANAGAGKTTVLVRRVIRLLLAGNPPARILCLTFTKAAAANMAGKVLDTLSQWVRLDDAALDEAIREISNLSPTPALRASARRLFAQALETPGGLKVQTIHAFCDRVLHQFPMEARVQAGFEVLDDVQETALLRRAREAVLVAAANEPESALGRALGVAVAAASDDSFDKALGEAVRNRRKLARLEEIGGARAVAEALALRPEDTVAGVTGRILNEAKLPRTEWRHAAAALLPLGGNAKGCGEGLLLAADAADDATAVEEYLSIFFTGKGEPRDDSGFGSAKARDAAPELFTRILAERDRLIDLRNKLYDAQAQERTAALLTLAAATIERFEREKRARGALDYADLIEKTADMLRDTGAAWVLYKLDGGIDHILIDEAQDTSPEQWNVIEKLTEEFFAGHGAREERGRTIFVVGDEKQSIFSFQGADPRLFGEQRRRFDQRVNKAGRTFRPESLLLSFRSAPGVLDAVDRVFARPTARAGLSSDDTVDPHEAVRKSAPALVEIWETEKAADDRGGLAWDAPLDARSEQSPVVQLARRIADAVKFWISGNLAIEDRVTRRLRAPGAGDVIVLVRQRGPLFDAILQALKRADVPVAGADRLMLHEHIAVMDLMALGDALALEADDLALASVLKSPLFGLTEEDLYTVAHDRKGTLASELAKLAPSGERFAAAAEKLSRWRDEASTLRPFDFYSRVLGRDGGRRQMLARLGHEAADAIDEFLARALAYEQTETPTVTGFLNFLRRAGTEVKRDLEVESEAVRVMTVHGAKGLEAPLVVLADTTTLPDGRSERLYNLPDTETFVWAGRKEFDSRRLGEARQRATDLREAEYRRLLYVAMTRAADALIVCGHEGRERLKDGCWYRLVRDALEAEPSQLTPTTVPYAAEPVLRWRSELALLADAPPARPGATVAAEPWLVRAAPRPTPAPPRILPSRFDPDDASRSPYAKPAAANADPRLRGELIHRLLQSLPDLAPTERESAGRRYLASAAGDLADAERDAMLMEALRVIDHEELSELFGPGSRAEVDVIARTRVPLDYELSGRIDRLAVTASEVIFADFKSGTPAASAADAPLNYVKQLALYCDALARIYPGKAMRALLVWTAGPAIHRIETSRLDSALRETLRGTPLRPSP